MRTLSTLMFAALTSVLCNHCSSAPDLDVQGEDEGALFAGLTPKWSDYAWPDPSNIPVCWEPRAAGAPAFTEEKKWAQQAVASTWTAVDSRVQFKGWGTCNATSKGIRIKIGADEIGPHSRYGTTIDGQESGMVLAFDLKEQVTLFPGFSSFFGRCLDSDANRRKCLDYVTVHEFGHALGFRHEQDRSDTPAPCDREQDAQVLASAGVTTGPYDPDSVMNYCKVDRVLSGASLSPQDKVGINKLYPCKGADGKPTPNAGRPFMEFDGFNYPVSGRPNNVFFEYSETVASLLSSERSVAILEGAKTTRLTSSAWQPYSANGVSIVYSTLVWTPPPLGKLAPGEPVPSATFEFNGQAEGTFQAVPVALRFNVAPDKIAPNQPLSWSFDTLSQPGVTPTFTVGFAVSKDSKATNVPLTAKCVDNDTGKTCTVASVAALPPGDYVDIDATGTGLNVPTTIKKRIDIVKTN